MLWMSLHFPGLALECLPGLTEAAEPWALEVQGTLTACNAVAEELGLQPGLTLSAARVRVPHLNCRPAEPLQQQQALEHLAEMAMGFSAQVVLEPPQALVFEIGASLRYFGGLEVVLTRVQAALQARRFVHHWSVAPTPLAALWLARHGHGSIVLPDTSLSAALGHLPVGVLGLPPRVQAALQGVGLDTLGQCLAMPARTLAVRHGLHLVNLLDRALGRMPDPRIAYQPADIFVRSVELPVPFSELARLLPVLDRLLPDLVDWAQRHGQLLTRLQLDLLHERQSPTSVQVGFAGTRRIGHLQLVMQEQLQRIRLVHPVAGMRLTVLHSVVNDQPEAGLLPAAPVRLREGQELMERLRARLGEAAVLGLVHCHDHRPELASRLADLPTAAGLRRDASHGQPPRPLWLLQTPRDLGDAPLPALRRPLTLLAGPERIESGWWDGADVARDYFVAAEPDGAQYWVFRDCRGARHWYLHGVFA